MSSLDKKKPAKIVTNKEETKAVKKVVKRSVKKVVTEDVPVSIKKSIPKKSSISSRTKKILQSHDETVRTRGHVKRNSSYENESDSSLVSSYEYVQKIQSLRQRELERPPHFAPLEESPYVHHSFRERVTPKSRSHITFALASLTILIIMGNYVSPKSSADSAVFYPSSCLGGWINPQKVEGVPDVEGNADQEKFTQENSAVLPTGTNADIYCGGFSGEIKKNTKPTKILVALSWSKGKDIEVEKKIESESFASSSIEILDSSASSTVSFTLTTSSSTGGSLNTSSTTESSSSGVPSTYDEVASTSVKNATTTHEIKSEATSTSSIQETTEPNQTTLPQPCLLYTSPSPRD
jgi:hypothetical protein